VVATLDSANAQVRDFDPTQCAIGKGGRSLECDGREEAQLATGVVDAVEEGVSAVPTAQWVPYERVVPNGGPNRETCTTTDYREVPLGVDPNTIPDWAFNDVRSGVYPACPVGSANPAVVESPQAFAARYWRDIPLPSPEPYIAPGRAITGMLAYLETRGSTTHTYTEPNTPFGPLQIVATGAYYVDWGDGTHTGPHSEEGGPWPDGRITHEYINVGTYDVVVTERWTATWSFGSESGTLDELRTVGRIDDFPVQQIQAVVLR
jgi:hypothetical protein